MKTIIISIFVAILIIVGALIAVDGGNKTDNTIPVNNVSIENGKQIITIGARGGYSPRKSIAKAGIPTMVRFVTNGTFDCSSSVRIPSLNISKILPQTGSTDIDLGIQKETKIIGSCGMGMYPFEINFQ